jgi:hypothetical protein
VNRRGNSGQILLIAMFVVAMLLLSAELYVFDVAKSLVKASLILLMISF